MNNITSKEVVGLIPAAGKASRIEPLPCSKELYPVGFRAVGDNNSLRPKVVSHYLLEQMRSADIKKAYIILRDGKWDIPSYFGDGKVLDMHLAYLMMDLPYGVPYTLDQAYPFIGKAIIALGFPDMIFQPQDAYLQLLSKMGESNADVVLGIYPASQPHKTDMLEMDKNGRIRSIIIKPERTDLIYSWVVAVWTPVFTHFMHDYILSIKETFRVNKTGKDTESKNELFVGDVIQAAIKNDMKVDSVIFEDGDCLDIGTPEDLVKAVQIACQASEKTRGN